MTIGGTFVSEVDHRCSERLAFFLPNLEGGGTERAIVTLANHVAEFGLTVDLVLGEAVGPYLSEVSSKVRIVNLSTRSKLRAILSLMSYLRRHRVQVVMSSLDLPNIQLIIASKLSGFKGRTVISQRATIAPVYAECGWMQRMVYDLGIQLAYPWANSIICNSHAASIEIRKIPGVRNDRVVTIHNSVDAERINCLAEEPLKDDWFMKSSSPLILSVGSMTHLKDRGTLVRAFAIVKAQRTVRLAIVGAAYQAAERNKIERLISEFGLNEYVYLPGFDANPFKWMSRAAVLVSSSITEGCPNQILEALSLATPIVATDSPGDTAEILGRGQWGRLVPAEDPERMAAAILETLDDPFLPDGRIRAADFSPSKTARAYKNVLLPGFDENQVKGLKSA